MLNLKPPRHTPTLRISGRQVQTYTGNFRIAALLAAVEGKQAAVCMASRARGLLDSPIEGYRRVVRMARRGSRSRLATTAE